MSLKEQHAEECSTFSPKTGRRRRWRASMVPVFRVQNQPSSAFFAEGRVIALPDATLAQELRPTGRSAGAPSFVAGSMNQAQQVGDPYREEN